MLQSTPDFSTLLDSALHLAGEWYHQEADSDSDAAEESEHAPDVPPPKASEADSTYHLLEDEDRVTSILRDLPTEEYYHLLRKKLLADFPGSRPDVIEHISELEEFFDVCLSIGFSLGINKMDLVKSSVKLLGEIVAREGRKPDPAKVAAIKSWGAITNLKVIQEFLGTCNYSRLSMGPK